MSDAGGTVGVSGTSRAKRPWLWQGSLRLQRNSTLMGANRDDGFAGLLVVDLLFAGSRSLKDKRAPLRSIRQHLKNAGFSVAEVGGHDTWQRSELAISIVCRGAGDVERLLDEAFAVCERAGAE